MTKFYEIDKITIIYCIYHINKGVIKKRLTDMKKCYTIN